MSTVDQEDFRLPLVDALEALNNGLRHCRCPNGYHSVWGLLRAVGARRGLQIEAPVLCALMQTMLGAGSRVLIAGAADTASLQLLGGLASGRGARFMVADACPAPLRQAERVATTLGLDVQTVASDLADLPAPPPGAGWDLVFMHYTLGFSDADKRRRVLAALARGLAPAGRVVCAAKFSAEPAAADAAAAAQRWLQGMAPRLQAALADHPQAWAAAQAPLAAYAQERAQRRVRQPDLAELESDFTASGLQVTERLPLPQRQRADPDRAGPAQEDDIKVLVAVRAGDRAATAPPWTA